MVTAPVAATEPVPAIALIPVHVNARPWAVIEVDGIDFAATPIAKIPLVPGPHTFRARLPDGQVIERIVEIDEEHRFVVFP